MENGSVWLTIGIGVTVTVIGAILNTLITNKINEGNNRDEEIEAKAKEDRELFFKKFDEMKELYVRKDLYEQALAFHQKEVDGKFVSLVDSIGKLDKDCQFRFSEIKNLINEKFNGKNKGE